MSLTLAAMALVVTQPALEPRLLRFPSVSGNTVVFSYAGDLWSSDLTGGNARRITSHPAQEVRPRISPDGKMLAFSASYDGSPNVYVMPIEGGEPKRLTFDGDATNNVVGWSPDGKHILYTTAAGNFLYNQQRLLRVSPNGGIPQETPLKEVTEASYSADGNTIAFTRTNSYLFNWRRYRGGTQGRVALFDLAKGTYSELPSNREQSYFPMFVGNSVYYISDRNQGTLNLYRYDLGNRRDTQLTRFTDADIRFPSTDGKTIVFERDGFLWRYDIATAATTKVTPRIVTEALTARPRLRNLQDQIGAITLSPSASRLVVEARGELFSVPARNGDTRNLTNTPNAREAGPVWSPDGKTVAYFSDASGEREIWTMPQMGGTPSQLTTSALPFNSMQWSPDSKHLVGITRSREAWLLEVGTKKLTKVVAMPNGGGQIDWSPDSKWLTYSKALDSGLNAIFVYEVATGKETQVSNGMFSDSSPVFDLTGRYLYVISSRNFNPTFGLFEFSLKAEDAERVYAIPLSKDTLNPLIAPNDEEPVTPATPPAGGPPAAPAAPDRSVKIDFEGIQDRVIPLPLPVGNYFGLVGLNNSVAVIAPGGVVQWVDLTSRTVQPVGTFPAFQGLSLNANRTKAAVVSAGSIFVVDVRPGAQLNQRVDTSGVAAMWNPRAEWTQMFWEAWRFQRDNFYDKNMLGLDWKAIGNRYAAYLPHVNHRADLSYVLGLMIGELGTGHAYVQGGEVGVPPNQPPVAKLGVDYAVEGEFVKMAKVYRGAQWNESRRGPLGEPGLNVKDGTYLLEVDGVKLTSAQNPDELLLGKAGRFVTLTINEKPSLEGARKIRVRPVVSEGQIRYADFVEGNRRRVAELSGGRIGYMHISNTATEGAIDFIQGFWSQWDKDALLIDERWNGGGFIQPWFANVLARTRMATIQQRHGGDEADAPIHEGPKALLINQYAGSGGDFFPYMFRKNKLGPLIGTRTWGGLVGISGGVNLVDGGSVTSPEFSIFNPETNEIIAENTGIDPDIEVDMRPDLVAKGQDPQLEEGVKYLMEQLKKQPAKKPRTELPRIARPGRVGG